MSDAETKVEDALALLSKVLFPEGQDEIRGDLGHPLGVQLLEVHRLLTEAESKFKEG